MYKFGYLNGKIINTDKPQLFLDDIGLLRGFASFDFFRIYNSVPLDLKDHYQRFINSSKIIGLKVPISYKELSEILKILLSKNKIKDAHVRVILTGGKTNSGLLPTKPNIFILLEEMKNLPDNLYKNGGKLVINEHLRLFAEAKTTNYLQAVSLQKSRIKNKAIEILYVFNGSVLEAATSNIFIVKDKEIITPKEKVLSGITRKIVIKLAKNSGYKVIERDIKEKELYSADEVFLTATNKKVLPIVAINNKKISDGKVGEISRGLNQDYAEYIVKFCNIV